jgi:hypothetical protein
MSIATSRNRPALRPASMKVASTPRFAAAARPLLQSGVSSTPSQRSACAWMGVMLRAGGQRGDRASTPGRAPGPLEYQVHWTWLKCE